MQEIKGRILYVDDDKDTRDMMSALLGLEGYEVVPAQTVAEGLTMAMSEDFDLVLLDWVFPDGTGIELCQKLRENGTPAPILFYSGMSYSYEIEKAMSAGAQGFLIKPVDVQELLVNVARFIPGDGDSTRHVN